MMIRSPAMLGWAACFLVCLVVAARAVAKPPAAGEKPNIILILADDLGYGDLGCYGQRRVRTPNLDRMAAEGLRFTQFYAGSTVCAPSRCVLMTGLHTGHCRVRGNADPERASLGPEDLTVATLLKRSGYATALVGKWGLGDDGVGGLPDECGFDYFYGYLNHIHAHNYYPEFLWRNREKVPLRNEVRLSRRPYGGFTGGVATRKADYSHDLFVDEALRWVERNQEGPFFLYLALTIPHANNEAGQSGMEVPDLGGYEAESWPPAEKAKAAMITRMDEGVSRLLQRLRELGIDRNTLVLFSSDNGPHREGGVDPEFFDSNGPLRGTKRDLYEGGVRVPIIAWWPGAIRPGDSDHVGYLGDILATAAELADATPPENLDSVSLVATLAGRTVDQRLHDHLYWEFYERGGTRALRWGNWKAVRPKWHAPIELYDLESDPGEQRDVAAMQPDVAGIVSAKMDAARTPSDLWPIPKPVTEGKQP